MPPSIITILNAVAGWLEIFGAGALILGFVVSTGRFLVDVKALGSLPAFHRYRQSLGRVVVIGLEILVAATIIKTITIAPTPAALGKLAIMIAIRTILSWSMVLEITGRWPWQAKPVVDPSNAA